MASIQKLPMVFIRNLLFSCLVTRDKFIHTEILRFPEITEISGGAGPEISGISAVKSDPGFLR